MKKQSIHSIMNDPNAAVHPSIGMIHSLPITDIHLMPNSPFKIRDDPSMFELIESIMQYGVLAPVEVRPRADGGYVVISGARRRHAALAAGLSDLPAIILDLDDDDAIIRMVDSNIQRESILPSERGYAYKMRLDAIKRKSGRPTQVGKNTSTGVAGGCHLTGEALCSSRDASNA